MAHDYKSLVWFPDNSAGKQCLIAFIIYNPLQPVVVTMVYCMTCRSLFWLTGDFNLSDQTIWSRAFNPLCFSSFSLHQWVWALFSSLSPSANLQLSSPCLHTGPWPGVLLQQCVLLSSDSHQPHWAKGEWSGLHFLRFTNHTVQTAQLPSSVLETNPSHLSSPSQQLTYVSWGSFSIRTVSTSYCNSYLPPAQIYKRTDLQYTGSRPSTHWVTSGILRFISTFKGLCSL